MVARLIAEDTMRLQYVLDRGFKLNTALEVVEKEPFEGPLTINIDGSRRIIAHNMAQMILVEVLSEASQQPKSE